LPRAQETSSWFEAARCRRRLRSTEAGHKVLFQCRASAAMRSAINTAARSGPTLRGPTLVLGQQNCPGLPCLSRPLVGVPDLLVGVSTPRLRLTTPRRHITTTRRRCTPLRRRSRLSRRRFATSRRRSATSRRLFPTSRRRAQLPASRSIAGLCWRLPTLLANFRLHHRRHHSTSCRRIDFSSA
jgi:hypothetical protein